MEIGSRLSKGWGGEREREGEHKKILRGEPRERERERERERKEFKGKEGGKGEGKG